MDYIKEQAGLDDKIDEELETPEAVKNVSASGKGFVIFGMHGKDSGHAVGLYRNRDGVRFFDPNHGEVFFEDRADFQGYTASGACAYHRRLCSGQGRLDGGRAAQRRCGSGRRESRADHQPSSLQGSLEPPPAILSEFVDLCSRDVLLYAAEKEAREAAATDEHQRAEKHNAAPVQAHQVY